MCRVDDCDKTKIKAHGWCEMHYSRWRRTGDTYRPSMSEGYVNRRGYRIVHLKPHHRFYDMAQERGRIYEHRLVMAEHLDRPLRDDETVHHIDGNRLNNHISNLQLRVGSHGQGVVYECATCGSRDLRFAEV